MIKTLRKKMMTFIVKFSLPDSGKGPYGSLGISPPLTWLNCIFVL